jgi:hypothetical protein
LICTFTFPTGDSIMKKIATVISAATLAVASASAFAWGGWGPWGDSGYGDGWGDGWGDGSGDFNMSFSGGGHGYGRGYGRGYGNGYGYGYGGYGPMVMALRTAGLPTLRSYGAPYGRPGYAPRRLSPTAQVITFFAN